MKAYSAAPRNILMPFSLMLVRYFPDLGVLYSHWSGERMWVGVAVHKNSFGCLCLMVAFFLMWSLYRRWHEGTLSTPRLSGWADLSVLILALFLLRGEEHAYSATSMATMGFGVCCLSGLLWLRKVGIRPPLLGLLAVAGLLIGLGVSAPFLRDLNVAAFTSALGRDETLTGRTDVWAELLPVVLSRPFFGFGFGSFWTTARSEFYRISSGHNGYLDTILELGIVGMGFYTAWLIACARRLHAALAEHYEWASLGLCFLLMALVYNVAESALNSLANQLTAQVVLLSWLVAPEPARLQVAGATAHVPAGIAPPAVQGWDPEGGRRPSGVGAKDTPHIPNGQTWSRPLTDGDVDWSRLSGMPSREPPAETWPIRAAGLAQRCVHSPRRTRRLRRFETDEQLNPKSLASSCDRKQGVCRQRRR